MKGKNGEIYGKVASEGTLPEGPGERKMGKIKR